jgi:hypothetical protein
MIEMGFGLYWWVGVGMSCSSSAWLLRKCGNLTMKVFTLCLARARIISQLSFFIFFTGFGLFSSFSFIN